MNILSAAKRKIKNMLFPAGEADSGTGYDLWSATYDDQPGNLMLDLDEAVFSELTHSVTLTGKTVADIGCGTGRHWKKLYAGGCSRLTGYDVSQGMLSILEKKFPAADVHLVKDGGTLPAPDGSADLIVCTLALAHMSDMERNLSEWNRILKAGGQVILTDYHPAALARGGDRTFTHQGKTVAIKNHVHPLQTLRDCTAALGWKEEQLIEKKIGPSVKHYFEAQNALHVYKRFEGTPIIYGIRLNK